MTKTCVGTKKMVAGLAHEKYLKKQHIVQKNTKNKKGLYKQKTNILI